MPDSNNEKPNKRDIILEAALDLVAEFGLYGHPVPKIAEKAGVSVGTIYRYFKSKEDLIHELHDSEMQRFVKEVERPYDPDASLREQVIRYFTDVLTFLTNNPKTFMLFEQYFYSPYSAKLERDERFSREPGSDAGGILKKLTDIGKEQKIIKDLPFSIIFSLSIGPILTIIPEIHTGNVQLDAETAFKLLEGCWDSIKV